MTLKVQGFKVKDAVLLRQADVTRRLAHAKQIRGLHAASLLVERFAFVSLDDILKDGREGRSFSRRK